MKGLLILILTVAMGYVGYQYGYPILTSVIKLEKPKEVVEAPAPVPKAKKKRVVVVEPPKPAMEPKPEPKPEPVKPQMAATPPPAPMPAADPSGYVPPTIPSIEERTQNWTVIPPSIFPRQIVMKRDLNLAMKMGNNTASRKVKSGETLFAVSQEGTSILVAPTAASPMRGAVALEDTNLKEIIIAGYENWKVAYLASDRRSFDYRKANPDAGKPTVAVAKGKGATAGNDKPARDKDGTYPLLVASMKSGQVTEIKPDAIKEWGEPVLEDGIWKVNVKYETMTMFGKFDTEAQAQIKNGVIEKWIYTGSGEVVP